MSRKILAFYSPYPRAGKTEAAGYLMFNYDSPFNDKLSFAGPLHDMVDSVFTHLGLVKKGYFKDTIISTVMGFSKRDFLIAWGNAARKLYPNFWVDYLHISLKNNHNSDTVIDDLRFPNEYKMLREEGAKIVRITNPGRDVIPSETEALLEGYEFDAELVNDKQDIKKYYAQLDKLWAKLWPDEGVIKWES